MSLLPAIIAALVTVAAAGGAAFLGAWFSPRRHRSEQLWDRKLEVYTRIFNAINDMQEEYEALLDEEVKEQYHHNTKIPHSSCYGDSHRASKTSKAIPRRLISYLGSGETRAENSFSGIG
jgi:hypothetical protein